MDNKQKVLELLFKNGNQTYHIRQISRETNLHPNTIIKITDELQKEELINKVQDKDTNRVLIIPNQEQPYFKLKKICFNVELIHKSGLIKFLAEKYYEPTVILFGSIAKGEDTRKSDIDLFLITDDAKEISLNEYEKILGKEIQIFIYTPESWKKLMKSNPELCNNVINGQVLNGFLEVLK